MRYLVVSEQPRVKMQGLSFPMFQSKLYLLTLDTEDYLLSTTRSSQDTKKQ